MRLLRIALANKRWDLAAHAIILATASVLKNGDRPNTYKSVLKRRSPGTCTNSGARRVVKLGGREFEREKRSPKR